METGWAASSWILIIIIIIIIIITIRWAFTACHTWYWRHPSPHSPMRKSGQGVVATQHLNTLLVRKSFIGRSSVGAGPVPTTESEETRPHIFPGHSILLKWTNVYFCCVHPSTRYDEKYEHYFTETETRREHKSWPRIFLKAVEGQRRLHEDTRGIMQSTRKCSFIARLTWLCTNVGIINTTGGPLASHLTSLCDSISSSKKKKKCRYLWQ